LIEDEGDRMGLDTSHDAWHGAYSAFMSWRLKIAELIGINLRTMEGFDGDNKWEALKPDPLHVLLSHSDCDGEIAWQDCGPIADRLYELIEKLPDEDTGGHIGNWRDKTRQFADGCRAAFEAKENLDFH
jgi:hypothetical protein